VSLIACAPSPGACASLTTAALAAGAHAIEAVYGGDSLYTGSTGAVSGGQAVNKATLVVSLSNMTQTYTSGNLTPTASTTPSVTINWTGAPQRNAGSYPVTATIDDTNYQGSANGTFTIGQAPLTITAASNSKIFNGGVNAAAAPVVAGLQGSDTATGLAEIYATASVGAGKTLAVSAYTINDGNSGNNYLVTPVPSTAGVINSNLAATARAGAASAGWSSYPGVSGYEVHITCASPACVKANDNTVQIAGAAATSYTFTGLTNNYAHTLWVVPLFGGSAVPGVQTPQLNVMPKSLLP
jgi:hypothetical protein